MWITVFQVSGAGAFPIDMLRYECAFPSTEQDAGRIDRDMATTGRRVVSVARYHKYKLWVPTMARWHSFGWDVVTGSGDTRRV